MSYKHSKAENRIRASALLKTLKSRIGTASEIAEVRPVSMQAATSSDWWRLSKVAGVHVFNDGDGWVGDIVFKGLPPGVPTTIGSQPLATREEAIEASLGLLAAFAENDKLPLPTAFVGNRFFRFDDIEIPVPAEWMQEFPEKLAAEGYTEHQARGRLAFFRDKFAGDGPMTREVWSSLDRENMARIKIACGIAMTFGMNTYDIADGVWSEFEIPEEAPSPSPYMN